MSATCGNLEGLAPRRWQKAAAPRPSAITRRSRLAPAQSFGKWSAPQTTQSVPASMPWCRVCLKSLVGGTSPAARYRCRLPAAESRSALGRRLVGQGGVVDQTRDVQIVRRWVNYCRKKCFSGSVGGVAFCSTCIIVLYQNATGELGPFRLHSGSQLAVQEYENAPRSYFRAGLAVPLQLVSPSVPCVSVVCCHASSSNRPQNVALLCFGPDTSFG